MVAYLAGVCGLCAMIGVVFSVTVGRPGRRSVSPRRPVS